MMLRGGAFSPRFRTVIFFTQNEDKGKAIHSIIVLRSKFLVGDNIFLIVVRQTFIVAHCSVDLCECLFLSNVQYGP